MLNPASGTSDATALLNANSFLARMTKGPKAPANPIARNANKTGTVISRMRAECRIQHGSRLGPVFYPETGTAALRLREGS